MKINSAAWNRLFQSGSINIAQSETGVALNQSGARGTTKTDTISISSEGSSQREIGKIAKNVMQDISKLDGSDRIDLISKAVDEGSYQISAGAVADAILQHIFVE